MTDFEAWLASGGADVVADTEQGVDVEAMLARLLLRDLAAIERLGERDRLIIMLYHVEQLPFAEIAKVLGVTESRVCQLHTRAMSRLAGELVRRP